MSIVRDTQGNILNPVGPGCERYTDENSLTGDWFDSHPRPKVETPEEPCPTKTQKTISAGIESTLKVPEVALTDGVSETVTDTSLLADSPVTSDASVPSQQ